MYNSFKISSNKYFTLPICNGSLTKWLRCKFSPLANSSAEPFAKQEYNLMSSSLSGKLQNAILSCNCSGTGGYTCSTNSKGIWDATHFAASSVSDGTTILSGNRKKEQLKPTESNVKNTITINKWSLNCDY